MSFVAEYWPTDPTRPLLGAVYGKARSSRFSHREDAEARLAAALEINKNPCAGHVVEVQGTPEIVRHCDGAEAQAVGARCPKCKRIVEAN